MSLELFVEFIEGDDQTDKKLASLFIKIDKEHDGHYLRTLQKSFSEFGGSASPRSR